MSLDGLLTFVGILLAILAIASPVQRPSLRPLVRMWLLLAAVISAAILIALHDGTFLWNAQTGSPNAWIKFWLRVSSFVIPTAAAILCWFCWERAKLDKRKRYRVV